MRVLNPEQQKEVYAGAAQVPVTTDMNNVTVDSSEEFDWTSLGGAAGYGAIVGVLVGGVWNFSGKTAEQFMVNMAISAVIGASVSSVTNIVYQFKIK